MKLSVSSKDLLKARQMAKRKRTSVACSRCKMAKSKCTEYRPCKRCVDSRVECEKAQPAVYVSSANVSIYASSDSNHGTMSKAANVMDDSFAIPKFSTLGADCHQIKRTATCRSKTARCDGQQTASDFHGEILTSGLIAKQPQLSMTQNHEFLGFYALQQQSRNEHSSRTTHFADGYGRVTTFLRSEISPQLPPQHPTTIPFLPAMQTSRAALIPPAAMALLSAWATPPPPTLAPFGHLLPAFALPPPPAYPLPP